MNQQLQQKNKSVLFVKAKQKAIVFLEKYFKGADISAWNNDKIDKVANLIDWPSNNGDLHHVPASAKGIILKAHLKDLFPNSKFSVSSPHYGSLDVKFLGGAYPFGLEKIEKIYVNPGNSDSQSDYYDFDLHILLINDISGDQHFYNGPDEAVKQLDKLIAQKKNESVSYYDKAINYLVGLIGAKAN